MSQYEQQGTAYIADALTAQWLGDGYDLQITFDEDLSCYSQGFLLAGL